MANKPFIHSPKRRTHAFTTVSPKHLYSIMYSISFSQNEREAERSRVERDQERIAKALQAARGVGDKEEEIKELALQVDALKVH